jgi:hypothetical protein
VKLRCDEYPVYERHELIVTITELPQVNTVMLYAGKSKEDSIDVPTRIVLLYDSEEKLQSALAKLIEFIDFPISIQVNHIKRQNIRLKEINQFTDGRFDR